MKQQVRNEVRQASYQWIENFNAGDAEGCAAGYAESAVMNAHPHGTFLGRANIEAFWRQFLQSGASGLCYTDVDIEVKDEDNAVLSASWSMNVGSGIITKEWWQRQSDGPWKLVEDDFEVQQTFEPDTEASREMKSALVVIDLQRDYFPGGAKELSGIESAAVNAQRLLKSFRERGLPTFLVQHQFLERQAPFFVPGTTGVKFHPTVAAEPQDVVIVKNDINSLLRSQLLGELRAMQIEHLVICGAMSHVCIDAAVRAAADLGFSCHVAHDACAACDLEFGGIQVPAEQVHAAFMAALAFAYAEVLSTNQILQQPSVALSS